MVKLNARQQSFVNEYLVDLNGKAAAIRAGYSPRSAESIASELLRNPKVAASLAEAQAARADRVRVTADDVLRELSRLAFADPAKCFGPDGRVLPIHEMPPEARAALAGLEVEEHPETGATTRKMKGWDKVRALELLAKHLGMLREKVEIAAAEPVSIRIDMGAGKA